MRPTNSNDAQNLKDATDSTLNSSVFSCRICGNQKGQICKAREMMLGLREQFDYFECSSCGCLQIVEFPEDTKKYYPETYRFSSPPEFPENFLKRFFKRKLAEHYFGQKNLIGGLLANKYSRGSLPIGMEKISHRLKLDDRILEVGCGIGSHLRLLKTRGFRNLLGIDPFVEKDCDYGPSLQIKKKFIHEINGPFDFIMLMYSFEHMPNPAEILRAAHGLLAADGMVLIRIPVAGCYAWRKYGVNWVQLDAPRHFFLHTEKSLNILAERAGLEIFDRVYDSKAFQFWGSEQYLLDIPLIDSRSPYKSKDQSLFSAEQMTSFAHQAQELNQSNDGDTISFYLRAK